MEYEVGDREGDVRFPRSEITRAFRGWGIQVRFADFGNVRVEESSEYHGGNYDADDSREIQIGKIRPTERGDPIRDS